VRTVTSSAARSRRSASPEISRSAWQFRWKATSSSSLGSPGSWRYFDRVDPRLCFVCEKIDEACGFLGGDPAAGLRPREDAAKLGGQHRAHHELERTVGEPPVEQSAETPDVITAETSTFGRG
jgi:hypothetical protein